MGPYAVLSRRTATRWLSVLVLETSIRAHLTPPSVETAIAPGWVLFRKRHVNEER